MRVPVAALAVLLSGLPVLAEAQSIWRCGNSYSQTPCEQGQAIAAADPRTAADARQAAAGARADAKLAEALEKARLAQEKAAPRAIVMQAKATEPARDPGSPQAQAHRTPNKGKDRFKRPEKPDYFTAVAPRR